MPFSIPDCWGHRGASAAYPENTLASFAAAIAQGAHGIESDVHVSKDGVVVMFHDPALDRTTDSTGLIRERNWHVATEDTEFGPLKDVRTKKEPQQPIPTFAETIELLMKPDNQHMLLNVDVKPHNSPTKLFNLMHATISSYPSYETVLAPRIVLGLWHPSFIEPAKSVLGYCKRAWIGRNLESARKFFWQDCSSFSVNFGSLATREGEKFRKECRDAGKGLMVWTVNKPEEMMEIVRWQQAKAIITDTPTTFFELRNAMNANPKATQDLYSSRMWMWTNWNFYTPVVHAFSMLERYYLEKVAGPYHEHSVKAAKVDTVA